MKKSVMSFNEYLEDMLDLHDGLMSDAELDSARKSYNTFVSQKSVTEHPDMKLPLAQLRERCQRLVNGQSGAIARSADKPEYAAAITIASAAVAEGQRLLSEKRPTKAQFIAHAEMNANASRAMNAVK